MAREEQMMNLARLAELNSRTIDLSKKQVFMSAYIQGWKAADSHPQWIPVEERLPKFDEQVLVYGLCPNGCRLFYVDCLIQDINDNGYPKWDDDTIIPTHWMPIVPPRKED